jgi:hypothetical protein
VDALLFRLNDVKARKRAKGDDSHKLRSKAHDRVEAPPAYEPINTLQIRLFRRRGKDINTDLIPIPTGGDRMKPHPWTKKVLAMGEKAKQEFKVRLDGFANAMTGVGTARAPVCAVCGRQ